MSLKHFPTFDEADRRVIRATILTCIEGAMALALAALTFAATNEGAGPVEAAPGPMRAIPVDDPIASVPAAGEALSTAPWRPEPGSAMSGG